MNEKRKFPRLNVTEVIVNLKKEELSEKAAHTKNISCGGVCLAIDASETVAVGDIVRLEFRLPKGEIINSKGKVVWTESFDIISEKTETRSEAGIEFLDMSGNDRSVISQFVMSRLPVI
ncbi:MAG: PilZ domain-containing protein [Candidatus Omnitrophota bacterium]